MNPRVIAGIYRNREIEVPTAARAFTSRVKQSLFDLITPVIENSTVLDMFAGSGSLGIEALSRGASHATFVDIDLEAEEFLKKNLSKIVQSTDKYSIRRDEFENFIRKNRNKKKYDLIFVDPPFELENEVKYHLLKRLMHNDSFGVIKLSKTAKIELPNSFKIIVDKVLGINRIIIFQVEIK